MKKTQKRKVSEEKRELSPAWTSAFAFTSNDAGLPVCLICDEKLSNDKKCNVERHYQTKHSAFAEKYTLKDERQKAISELQQQAEARKLIFKKWISSQQQTTVASFFGISRDCKKGKPFTDGEYIKKLSLKYQTIYSSILKTNRNLFRK